MQNILFRLTQYITPNVSVEITSSQQQKQFLLRKENAVLPIQFSNIPLTGKVIIQLPNYLQSFEHSGIEIYFVGELWSIFDDVGPQEIISLYKKAEKANTLHASNSPYEIPFRFAINENNLDDSYYGNDVILRYFVKIVVHQKRRKAVEVKQQVYICNPRYNAEQILTNNPSLRLEVGIGDVLLIIIRLHQTKFLLNDVISGVVKFKESKISIMSVELSLVRREVTIVNTMHAIPPEKLSSTKLQNGEIEYTQTEHQTSIMTAPGLAQMVRDARQEEEGEDFGTRLAEGKSEAEEVVIPSVTNFYSRSETLTKFEIVDGPVGIDQYIPFRMFLGSLGDKLSPSFSSVQGRFSVKYYLNFVFVDDLARKFYKQQEVEICRAEVEDLQ